MIITHYESYIYVDGDIETHAIACTVCVPRLNRNNFTFWLSQ